MAYALVLWVVLLLLTWLGGPVGAGPVWDALNALGFVALAALLALHLHDLGPRAEGDRRAAHASHAWLAWATLALVAVHAAGLVAYDPVLVEYLQPGAPAYMWAGVAAALALGVAIWSARVPRRRTIFGTRERFRRFHRLLAAGAVGVAVWHVAGSGFYLPHWSVTTALVVAAAGAVFAPRTLLRGLELIAPRLGPWAALTAALAVGALHTGLRNV